MKAKAYNVLVVDSVHEDFRRMVATVHPSLYLYLPLPSQTNEACIQIARESMPDLILLDGDSFGAIETITQLKKHSATCMIPIIMAASLAADTAQLQQALAAGALDFIRKPIHPAELAARLYTALHLRKNEINHNKRQIEMEQLTEALFLLNETIEEKNQELYQSVITDSLTKIYNRAFLMETMAKEFSRNRRHNLPLSCIMIDIDHFKSFNDLYSHKVGDFILIEVTAAIQKIIRSEDIFGRLGGEEFLLILPGCAEEDSRIVAEKVRLHIENYPFVYKELRLHPRISLGVADNEVGRPLKFEDLMHHADLALYEAKRGGRNRTILFSAIMSSIINKSIQ